MKEKIMRHFLLLTLALTFVGRVMAQTISYQINSSDQLIIIEHKGEKRTIGKAHIKGQNIYPEDYLLTPNGKAALTIITPTGAANFWLPTNSRHRVADVVSLSMYRIDVSESLFRVGKKLYDKFMRSGETPNTYRERFKPVIGGSPSLSNSNLFNKNPNYYKSELRLKDLQAIQVLYDSLAREKTNDSTLYFLETALLLEDKRYFMLAKDQYFKALEYNKGSKAPSPLLQVIYKEYLLRLGDFKEAEKFKGIFEKD